jgi:hypothetical protein
MSDLPVLALILLLLGVLGFVVHALWYVLILLVLWLVAFRAPDMTVGGAGRWLSRW